MAVTHFVTHFTHVSRHFGGYCRKKTKILRENCFENVVSEINGKWFKKSTKLLLERVQRIKKKLKKNDESI